jgi:hypothetical protein
MGVNKIKMKFTKTLFWTAKRKMKKGKRYGRFIAIAPLAQLVEQLPLKEMVVGSNPTGRTKLYLFCAGRETRTLTRD